MSKLDLNEIALVSVDGNEILKIETPIADKKGFKVIEIMPGIGGYHAVNDKDLDAFCLKLMSVLGYKIR